MKKKHYCIYLLLAFLLMISLAGCGQAAANSDNSTPGDTSTTSSSAGEEVPAEAKFSTEVKARYAEGDDREWQTTFRNGSIVEIQIQYANTDDATHDDVNIRVNLPEEFIYIEGSTKLYSAAYPDGAQVNQDDIITDEGIYIGSFIGRQDDTGVGANAFVRFQVKISSDAQAGNHFMEIFVSARRADLTESTTRTQRFTASTPLASMP